MQKSVKDYKTEETLAISEAEFCWEIGHWSNTFNIKKLWSGECKYKWRKKSTSLPLHYNYDA